MNNTVFINFEIRLIRNDGKELCLVRLKLNKLSNYRWLKVDHIDLNTDRIIPQAT